MRSIASGDFDGRSGGSGSGLPLSAPEQFVAGIYASVDMATTRELDRQRNENGIVPTCTLGCCHCCRFHVVLTIAEAYTLARFVKRGFSKGQIDTLRMRTRRWHDWDSSRPGRYDSPAADIEEDFSDYQHFCPLLVNGTCSAYPVRPLACRMHFVTSDAIYCDAANDRQATSAAPQVLLSVVDAASLFSKTLQEYIESTGRDYSQSNMLLPHWLAIQMEWNFAVEP